MKIFPKILQAKNSRRSLPENACKILQHLKCAFVFLNPVASASKHHVLSRRNWIHFFDSCSRFKKVSPDPPPAPGLIKNVHSDSCLHSKNLKLINRTIYCSHLNQISFDSSTRVLRHNHNEITTAINSLINLHKQSCKGYVENTSCHLIYTIELSPLYCKLAR